jgi:hypothetical protein
VVFGYFIVDINNNYDTSINESQFDSMNNIAELNNLSKEMNSSLNQIQSNNPLDVVGGLLTSGFTVIKTTQSSFGVYTDVTSSAIDNANLGEATSNFKIILLIIGILLFIFALVGILTGRVI